jgi:hypothetical protein
MYTTDDHQRREDVYKKEANVYKYKHAKMNEFKWKKGVEKVKNI